MTLPRIPAAVVFDMDGLLFDTETLYREAILAAAAAAGHELSPALYLGTIGLTGPATRDYLAAHVGPAFDFETVWADASRRFHRLAETRLRLKAGVPEILAALDGTAMPRAIATSSRRESVEHHLAMHGLKSRFPVIVAQGDYPRGKPRPILSRRRGTARGGAGTLPGAGGFPQRRALRPCGRNDDRDGARPAGTDRGGAPALPADRPRPA